MEFGHPQYGPMAVQHPNGLPLPPPPRIPIGGTKAIVLHSTMGSGLHSKQYAGPVICFPYTKHGGVFS